MKRFMLASLLIAGLLFAVSCSKDDDNGTNADDSEVWEGTWLSAGENVAVLLSYYFNYDSIRVEFRDDQTVTTDQHVAEGAWTTLEGTYTVTKADAGDVHSISIVYPAFEQQGIVEVTDGMPVTLRLEAVQTNPDIGAVPRTPESGFGSDAALGTSNIQTYVLED